MLPWHPALLEFVRDAVHVHLFIDFDGTLSPIHTNPHDAKLSPAAFAVLSTLTSTHHGRCRVTIVSGRHLGGLVERIALPATSIDLVGNHGSEWRIDGVVTLDRIAEAAMPAMARIAATLAPAVAAAPGAVLEQKGVSLSLHVRGANAADQESLRELADVAVAREHGVHVDAGKGVVEIRATGAPHKGDAIVRLLQHAHGDHWHRDCAALFIGDDKTDEDGFVALGKYGAGVRVLDGVERQSAARYCTASVDDTLAALASLGTVIGSPSAFADS